MMRLQVWPLFGLQDPQLWYSLEKDLRLAMRPNFVAHILATILALSYATWPSAARSGQATTAKSSTAAKPATKEPRSPRGSSNRSYGSISNIMKTKHDTVKNSISNVR
jgi:hypothetical protein